MYRISPREMEKMSFIWAYPVRRRLLVMAFTLRSMQVTLVGSWFPATQNLNHIVVQMSSQRLNRWFQSYGTLPIQPTTGRFFVLESPKGVEAFPKLPSTPSTAKLNKDVVQFLDRVLLFEFPLWIVTIIFIIVVVVFIVSFSGAGGDVDWKSTFLGRLEKHQISRGETTPIASSSIASPAVAVTFAPTITAATIMTSSIHVNVVLLKQRPNLTKGWRKSIRWGGRIDRRQRRQRRRWLWEWIEMNRTRSWWWWRRRRRPRRHQRLGRFLQLTYSRCLLITSLFITTNYISR